MPNSHFIKEQFMPYNQYKEYIEPKEFLKIRNIYAIYFQTTQRKGYPLAKFQNLPKLLT